MKYKCIIFDCDGVLVDSEPITARVLVMMAKDLGLQLDLDFVEQEFMGRSLNDITQHLATLTENGLPPNFESEYRRITYDTFKTELKPIAGIHLLLQKLQIPYCVASSGPLTKIHNNLVTTGLIDHFRDKMYSCYEIKSWKPKPDIFLYAAENMGYIPKECAVVEDSLVGVQAALAGGFDVFMYSKNGNKFHPGLDETRIFEDMNELASLLV